MNIEDGFAAEKRSASSTPPSSAQVQAKGTANSGLIAAVIGGVIVAAALGFLGGMQVNSRSTSSQSGPGGHGMMGSQTSQGSMSPPGQAGQSAGSGVQLGTPSNGANTTTQTQQGTTQQTTQDTTKNN